MNTLKATLLRILDAVSLVAGPSAQAIIALARWVIGEFIPDDPITLPAQTASGGETAAPLDVKTYIGGLFDKAIAQVSNWFFRRALAAVKNMVLNFAIDEAWDAIFTPVAVMGAAPKATKIGTNETMSCVGDE